MTLTIVRDTYRGATNRVVKAGTRITVVAKRMDSDGLKLLVAIGRGTGARFQIRADDTNYYPVSQVRR